MSSYVEQDCTFSFQGRTFESGGALVLGDKALVYAYPATRQVGNCRGDQKVSAHFGRIWKGNMGDSRQHVTFTWEGHRYSGTYYRDGSTIVRAKRLK